MVFWIADVNPPPDVYAAFRGEFELVEPAEVELLVFGLSWFVCWLDGEYLTEGPARFSPGYPEHERLQVALPAGSHVLAVQAHHVGVSTRRMEAASPFLQCTVNVRGSPVDIRWKGTALPAYASQVRRIDDVQGWIEWCDTRQLPVNWTSVDFADDAWSGVVITTTNLPDSTPLAIGPVQHFNHDLVPVAEGPAASVYGYEQDDPPARFFLRDLVCDTLPPQGSWRRYDLGRVRLGRMAVTLDVPEGAVVEMAYAEVLRDGRVAPYIDLTRGPSANMDHYVAHGGVQTFGPITPRGGRFVEVHVLTTPETAQDIRFMTAQFIERGYYGETEGTFHCSDERLNAIWQMGVDTVGACAEDALIDNPTRGRGQWAADVLVVGLDVAAVYSRDLRLHRRALKQFAAAAREDGVVAAVAPGEAVYLANYAAQWVTACMRYYRLTGDRSLLDELWRPALRNIAALDRDPGDPGITEDVGYVFIDRGYDPPEAPMDLALNLHFLEALKAMADWTDVLGKEGSELHSRAGALRARLREIIAEAYAGGGWEAVGYHAVALALDQRLFEESEVPAAVDYLQAHIRRCFPNELKGPRIAESMQPERDLFIPFFAHYTLRALAEHGAMPFVLDQYRACWGWALDQGMTTCPEIFDTRWSHCHQCAACPTWQLSRYVLGLHPRFDRGVNHLDFRLFPGGLEWAEGLLPLPEGTVGITWKAEGAKITYTLDPSVPIYVTGLPGETEAIDVTMPRTWVLDAEE